MNAHIDSHCALGDSAARATPPSVDVSTVVLPTVVVMSKRRIERPSAIADSTDPPSESSTIVAPRTSLVLAKASKSRAVLSVTTPAAEIQTRQNWPHSSAGPSVRHSKRIEDGLLSSFAMERSLADAITQAAAIVRTPTRKRIKNVP